LRALERELAPRDLQAFDEIAGACEHHTPAVLDERETDGGRKMALAAAGRTSVRVPGVSAFEVRITYPFHPRSGEIVAVVGSRQYGGADYLIVRQPARSFALLSAWMTEGDATDRSLLAHPWIPVERLTDLRTLLDAVMASYAGDSPRCEGPGHAESVPRSERFVRRSDPDSGATAGAAGPFD
jgi:hypothetical protein